MYHYYTFISGNNSSASFFRNFSQMISLAIRNSSHLTGEQTNSWQRVVVTAQSTLFFCKEEDPLIIDTIPFRNQKKTIFFRLSRQSVTHLSVRQG